MPSFFLSSAQFFALQILENLIKTRWKILPREQCEGDCKKRMKCMIVNEPKCVSFLLI